MAGLLLQTMQAPHSRTTDKKQISLLEAMDVDVMLNFNNSAKNNLGIRLPKGTVRVFTNDKEV